MFFVISISIYIFFFLSNGILNWNCNIISLISDLIKQNVARTYINKKKTYMNRDLRELLIYINKNEIKMQIWDEKWEKSK